LVQPDSPWIGDKLEDRARPGIEQLKKVLPKANTVWGGDWNQNLTGGWQNVGSKGLRTLVKSAVSALGLQVATTEQRQQAGSRYYTIDHIAVPSHWRDRNPVRIEAAGLSDHDAYVVEVDKA
jgi:hypothetical protein